MTLLIAILCTMIAAVGILMVDLIIDGKKKPVELEHMPGHEYNATTLMWEPKQDFDYTTLGDDQYAFLVGSGWEPDVKTKRHFEGRLRKVREIAEEQRRGIAQQRAMLEAQKQLDNMPIDGYAPMHPLYVFTNGSNT